MFVGKLFRFLICAFCGLLFTGCFSREQTQQNKTNSIKGVWEYVSDDVLDEVKGMSFFTDSHFAFVVNFKNDTTASASQILAHAGSYVLQDSIVTATINHSHNPALIGQNLRWIHNSSGITATYKVLDKTGKIVESGKVKRLE